MQPGNIYIGIAAQKPTFDNQGHFKWPVHFKLQTAAPQDGWIIQRILAKTFTYADIGVGTEGKFEVQSGNEWKQQEAPTIEFWEAWKVPAGAQSIDHEGKITDYDDEYEQSGTLKSRGVAGVQGWVKFYIGELPNDFVKMNGATKAWAVRSTSARPAFWDDMSYATRHNLVLRWTPESATCTTFAPDKTVY